VDGLENGQVSFFCVIFIPSLWVLWKPFASTMQLFSWTRSSGHFSAQFIDGDFGSIQVLFCFRRVAKERFDTPLD
jgi:hypothetical protein